MNVCLYILMMTSLGQCFGQSCPADFPLQGDVIEAEDNVCYAACEYRDTTLAIDIFNAQEVNFIFVDADGFETVVNNVVTQVDSWEHFEVSHAYPVFKSHVEMVWLDPSFMYANHTVTACQQQNCELVKCEGQNQSQPCVWKFTPNAGKTALKAGGYRINKGQELCVSCAINGKVQPFDMKIGLMDIKGHQNPYTTTITYYHAGIAIPAKAVHGPQSGTVRRIINDQGHKVDKLCFSADKDITIKNLKITTK